MVSPRRSSSNVLASSSGTRSMSGRSPGPGLDEVEGDVEHVEVAQPEEVHLQQAEPLDAVHLVLGDDRRVGEVAPGLGLALHRAGTR